MNILGRYVLNILVAVDQFVNVLAGGDPDETISSRLGKHYPNSLLTRIVNKIFFWDGGIHTFKYIEEDEGSKAIIK